MCVVGTAPGIAEIPRHCAHPDHWVEGKYGEQDCARRCASVYGCKYFAIGKGKDNVGSCYTSNRLDSNAVPQTVGSQDQYSATYLQLNTEVVVSKNSDGGVEEAEADEN